MLLRAIVLCVSGDYGPRCIYQYPPNNLDHNNNKTQTQQIMNYALSVNDYTINTARSVNALMGMSSDMFASVFCSKSTELSDGNQPYNIKINQYQYISRAVWLPYDHHTNQSAHDNTIANDDNTDTIAMFNIVYVCKVIDDATINIYDNISHKLCTVLSHEQHRCQFVSDQSINIINCTEEYYNKMNSDNNRDDVLNQQICDQSLLARHIRDLYLSLSRVTTDDISSNVIHLKVNNWIDMYCNVYSNDNAVDNNDQYKIKSYQTLLLRDRKQCIVANLPGDCSPLLRSFISAVDPTRTFRDLSTILQLPLLSIYRLAKHMVYWRQAYIIDVIHKHNTYVVSRSAHVTTQLQHQWNIEFGSTTTIYRLLAQLSIKQTLQQHIHKQHKINRKVFIKQVIFLLQHCLLEQLHCYLYNINTPLNSHTNKSALSSMFVVKDNTNYEQQNRSNRSIFSSINSSHDIDSIDNYIDDKAKLSRASNSSTTNQLFIRLQHYMNGTYSTNELIHMSIDNQLNYKSMMMMLHDYHQQILSVWVPHCHFR